jgi:hypothetical protein
MSDFDSFAMGISNNLRHLCAQYDILYTTSILGDDLYDHYLQSFPEGTNPLYRVRTEHDCGTCRHFIRSLGAVVAISGDSLVSIWDVEGLYYPYNVVATSMSSYVKSKPIAAPLRMNAPVYGGVLSMELVNNTVIEWNHFHGQLPSRCVSTNPREDLGQYKTTAQVLKRALEDITEYSIQVVLDLVTSNSIYRGEEHKPTLLSFQALKKGYVSAPNKELFIWKNINVPSAHVRNTAIGTLLLDISNGVDVEQAVTSFEFKVAPTNYKRPKSLITQGMKDEALKTIARLGLESSLSRRHALIPDININDVLWVDNRVRGQMKGGTNIADLLQSQVRVKPPTLDGATPIGIEQFLSQVLPTITSMQVLFENKYLPNLVNLTAPCDAQAPRIFKWDNNFGWSYRGNLTDSYIKEKVRKAGGNINADLRVSLAWSNTDDLDIHAVDPIGNHIYFANRMGVLDVDMNVDEPLTRTPVENLSWVYPIDGRYTIEVNNFYRRESVDIGFHIEVESKGRIWTYSYPRQVSNVAALTIYVEGGCVTSITPKAGLLEREDSKTVWGLKTNTLVSVDTLLLSPNYWGSNSTGNKHYFFILQGSLNEEPTRGIYNEFLRNELEPHRKVFEVLGDLTKVQPTNTQLSGVGFSSTHQDKVKVLVKGSKSKAYEIHF